MPTSVADFIAISSRFYEYWPPEKQIALLSTSAPTFSYQGIPFKSAQISTIRRDSADSAFGSFDTLPWELLESIFDLLDFQSLSRLSRTSLGAKTCVESYRAYRDIIEHALNAVTALIETGLAGHYLPVQVYETLRSEKCVSCGEFGAYLFLVTCERCCFECLYHNQSLWLITPNMAQVCFDLEEKHLRTVPIMQRTRHCIVGSGQGMITTQFPLELLSAGVAKNIALKEFGFIGEAVNNLQSSFVNWIRDAPLESLGRCPSTFLDRAHVPLNEYGWLGIVPFPTLSQDHGIEYGIWCLGCHNIWSSYINRQLTSAMKELLELGDTLNSSYRAEANYRRPRTKAGFLEHVKTCWGIYSLIIGGTGWIRRDIVS